jgi:hypothetical protein
MSLWLEQKALMRRTVHDARKEPATYTVPDESYTVEVNVRVHEGNRLIGDLDREGYGKVIGDCPRIIFDVAEVVPEYQGKVLIHSSNREYHIEAVRPMDGPIEIVCEVSELK